VCSEEAAAGAPAPIVGLIELGSLAVGRVHGA